MISRTNKAFRLLLVTFFLIISFFTYSFFYNPEENIINNDLIEWGAGWKNNQSFYSGSELGFIVDNTKVLSIEIKSESKADQELEIIIDNKNYYLSSSADSNIQRLTIYLDNKSSHKINIRHSCIYFYYPCELTLTGIYINKHANLLPFTLSKKIVSILGDSLSTIYGKQNYSRLFADSIGYQLHNASILGSTVSKVKDVDSATNRYEKDLKPFKSDLTIIFLGTNDVSNNVPLGVFESNYSQIVSDINRWNPDGKILLVGILPRNDISSNVLVSYDEVIKRISIANNAYFVDTAGWLQKSDFDDDIHPSATSQIKLAENFKEVISSKLR